jgi:hypothetical protein
MNGSAIRIPSVMTMPLRMSTVTIDIMPASAVNSTIVRQTMYMPISGLIRPSVTIARIQPPPRNW